jgi:hypothetical protein
MRARPKDDDLIILTHELIHVDPSPTPSCDVATLTFSRVGGGDR